MHTHTHAHTNTHTHTHAHTQIHTRTHEHYKECHSRNELYCCSNECMPDERPALCATCSVLFLLLMCSLTIECVLLLMCSLTMECVLLLMWPEVCATCSVLFPLSPLCVTIRPQHPQRLSFPRRVPHSLLARKQLGTTGTLPTTQGQHRWYLSSISSIRTVCLLPACSSLAGGCWCCVALLVRGSGAWQCNEARALLPPVFYRTDRLVPHRYGVLGSGGQVFSHANPPRRTG